MKTQFWLLVAAAVVVVVVALAASVEGQPAQPTTLTPITFTLMGEQERPVLWTVTDISRGTLNPPVFQDVTFDVRSIITIGPGGEAWEGKTYLTLSPYATAIVVDGEPATWRQRWIDAARAVHEDWTGSP